MAAMDQPTLAGFLVFIRSNMKIPVERLTDNDPVIAMAFAVALEIVNLTIQCASPLIYKLAVYNLAGDNIINYASDQPPSIYWAELRKSFDSNGFVPGVIQSAGDESTSDSYVIQEAAKNFTLANLQQLKTPWGRQYLAFAQSYGTLWGLS